MEKILLRRIQRKLLTIIGRKIPRNSFYRPKGIYFTSKDFINNVAAKEPDSACVEIFPKLTSILGIDEEFFKICILAYSKYTQLNKTVETTYLVTAIQNGRVYTDYVSTIAVISQDNHLIADISFNYNKDRVVEPQQNYIFHQKYFTEPVKYTGVVFSMLSGQGAIVNYAHWLIDVLPRIHLLKKSGWFDKVDYFLVPNYTYDYQKDSLKLLGIDKSKIIRGDQLLHITADVLIASTAPRGNDFILPLWALDFLRDTFLTPEILNSTSNYPPLVYISRKDSKQRQVTNEEEVVALVKQFGFQTFTLTPLPFTEKVKLFASAQAIVSTGGAGMYNVVFCKKGTKVLEIFSEGFVHAETGDKASKAGLDYHYIINRQDKKPANTYEALHQGFTVDINALKQKMESMF